MMFIDDRIEKLTEELIRYENETNRELEAIRTRHDKLYSATLAEYQIIMEQIKSQSDNMTKICDALEKFGNVIAKRY